ncbi:hypothetical protein EMIT0P201_12361 [Pseudomonas chlororaphis]
MLWGTLYSTVETNVYRLVYTLFDTAQPHKTAIPDNPPAPDTLIESPPPKGANPGTALRLRMEALE